MTVEERAPSEPERPAAGPAPVTVPVPTPCSVPAHREGRVLRWLAAYVLSLVGDSVYFVALAWSAQRTAGPAEVGLVMAAGALPRALLMLAGGVVADRFDPRRVILVSDAARCALILTMAAVIALTAPGLWVLVVVALVFGAVDAMFVPAVGSLPPRITTPDQLARVSGMRALAMRVSQIAGAPAGGLALGIGGPAAAFTVAGALFALSLPLLLSLRLRPLPAKGASAPEPGATTGSAGSAGTGGSVLGDLLDGLRYIRRHRLIGPLILGGAIFELGLSGPFNVGLVLLNAERGWGPSGYGLIVSGFGAGATAGAALLAVVGWLPRAGLVMSGTLLVSCVGAASIALAPALWVTVALAAAVGLCAGVFGSLNSTLIQVAADPAFLGRVTSVMMIMMVGLAPLSYPLVGAAIGVWGTAPVFVGCGLFSSLGVLVTVAAGGVRRAGLPRSHGRSRA
jgi:MFS family permease